MSSMSGAVRAGKVAVELGVDDTALQAGLRSAQSQLSGFFGAVNTLAGALAFDAIAGKITGFVDMWAEAGSKLYEEAKGKGGRLGDLVANPEDVGRAYDLAQAYESLAKATKSVKETIGGILAPAFEPVVKMLVKSAEATKEWLKQNEGIVQAIGWTVAGLSTLSAGILGFVGVVKVGALIVGSLGSAFGAIISIGTSLVGVLTNPFIWAGIAVAGLLAWLGHATGAFEYLKQIAGETWAGIADALSAGDIELAFEIAVLGMKVVFADFMDWFAKQVGEMGRLLGGIGQAFSNGVNAVFGRNWANAAVGALQGAAGLQNLTPRQALDEAVARARRAREQRDAEIRDRTFATPVGGGARGTFNATAAFGLLGPARDPVVEAIQSAGERQNRLMENANRILRDILDAQFRFVWQ